MIFDEQYWTARYLDQQTQWDTGSITTPLKQYIDQLDDKTIKILIPGCGDVYEAEYLHLHGFTNVFVIDFSSKPLDNFKQRCPDFPAQHLLKGDFFEHNGEYDLILEQTFFCALSPTMRPRYALTCNHLLKKNGRLVGLLFNVPLNADHPPFGGSMEEYEPYFAPHFDFHTFETSYNSIKPRAGRELFINLIKKSTDR